MTLTEFQFRLQKYVPRGSNLRPFVCSGPPLKRRNGIFIVGINPAKALKKAFWDYWDVSYGFDKEAHLQDLKQLPGGLGPARRNIEKIARAVGQDVVLDTNIYAFPAQSPGDIPESFKVSDAFEFLLREVHPRIVLAHGKENTVEFFRSRCGGNFVEDYEESADVTWDGIEFKLLCSHHLWLPGIDIGKIVRILQRALQAPCP